jgi:DNA-binding transcriptional regulator PaaX
VLLQRKRRILVARTAGCLGPNHAEETENLRVVMNHLRKEIEKDPGHPRDILTESWMGTGISFQA